MAAMKEHCVERHVVAKAYPATEAIIG